MIERCASTGPYGNPWSDTILINESTVNSNADIPDPFPTPAMTAIERFNDMLKGDCEKEPTLYIARVEASWHAN